MDCRVDVAANISASNIRPSRARRDLVAGATAGSAAAAIAAAVAMPRASSAASMPREGLARPEAALQQLATLDGRRRPATSVITLMQVSIGLECTPVTSTLRFPREARARMTRAGTAKELSPVVMFPHPSGGAASTLAEVVGDVILPCNASANGTGINEVAACPIASAGDLLFHNIHREGLTSHFADGQGAFRLVRSRRLGCPRTRGFQTVRWKWSVDEAHPSWPPPSQTGAWPA
eukprot:scaffold230343_cov24-Tisochrysis_lutea.AAC.2